MHELCTCVHAFVCVCVLNLRVWVCLGRYGDPVPADLSAPLEGAMGAYRTAETLQTMATRDSREARIANQCVPCRGAHAC